MDLLKFTFRLLKHSCILVLRVVGILLPAVGVLAATRDGGRSMTDYRHASLTGHFPDGTPERWEYKSVYVEDDDK
jgi:hypothetical protein